MASERSPPFSTFPSVSGSTNRQSSPPKTTSTSTAWAEKYKKESRRKYIDTSLQSLTSSIEQHEIKRKKKKTFLTRSTVEFRRNGHIITTPTVSVVQEKAKRLDTYSKRRMKWIPKEASSIGFRLEKMKDIEIQREKFSELWDRNSCCENCNEPGGDLECAFCNVICHVECFLGKTPKQTSMSSKKQEKVRFLAGDGLWICSECEVELTEEYMDHVQEKRALVKVVTQQKCSNVIKAGIRMMQASRDFGLKRLSAVKIQSAIRGKLARLDFNKIVKSQLSPYVIRIHRIVDAELTDPDKSSLLKLQSHLPDGFACQPTVVSTVLDGDNQNKQLFYFESKKLCKIAGSNNNFEKLQWNEQVIAPGVRGNAMFVFTIISRAGPRNYFLGQARLKLNRLIICKEGLIKTLDLDELAVQPLSGKNRYLELIDMIGGGSNSISLSSLALQVEIFPWKQVSSKCGFLLLQNSLNAIERNKRWCVLLDGTLLIYRHFGLTTPTQCIDLRKAQQIKWIVVDSKFRSKKTHMIGIIEDDRLWILSSAEDAEVQEEWMEKLLFGKSVINSSYMLQTQATSTSHNAFHATSFTAPAKVSFETCVVHTCSLLSPYFGAVNEQLRKQDCRKK